MLTFCPLCGKNKSEEALFCDDCTKKIRDGYEVEVPGRMKSEHRASTKENFSEVGNNCLKEENVSTEESFSEVLDTYLGRNERASRPVAEKGVASSEEEVPILDNDVDLNIDNADSFSHKPTHGKRKGIVFGCVLAIIGILGAFSFVYKQHVTRQTEEQIIWEAAMSANTVNAYLAYMNEYPNGKYFAAAEAKMKALKNREASAWENLKMSENIAEFHDFLQQYPDSPYRSLVRDRLDSLMWVAALAANTAESYSEYMVAADSGELPGNYYNEAQKRHEMLFQSYPVTEEELDKIKAIVADFYRVLSEEDYKKMAEYLSPKVYRFFNKGTDSRENILKGLQLSMSKNANFSVRFIPSLDALQYQKTLDERYLVNVPLVKEHRNNEGVTRTVSGYIGHIEMDSEMRILSIYETKPYGTER